jgi:hypothetical protein
MLKEAQTLIELRRSKFVVRHSTFALSSAWDLVPAKIRIAALSDVSEMRFLPVNVFSALDNKH